MREEVEEGEEEERGEEEEEEGFRGGDFDGSIFLPSICHGS